MKKVKLCIAGLLLSGLSYGQCTHSYNDSIEAMSYQQSIKTFKAIEYRIDDIIEAIRMDMFYGRITRENGMYYINEVLALKSKNEDLMSELFRNKIK